ncbi:MAG: hypothetical protein KY462_06160 [Actinobacteria bacterium]|nr:hypothetical protein [Actinomycetota bacterium]
MDAIEFLTRQHRQVEDFEEHHAVELLLQEVTDADPSDERFDAKISVIQEQVQHHVQEEEQELFPQVRDGLGDDALQELGDQMRQAAERGGQKPTRTTCTRRHRSSTSRAARRWTRTSSLRPSRSNGNGRRPAFGAVSQRLGRLSVR